MDWLDIREVLIHTGLGDSENNAVVISIDEDEYLHAIRRFNESTIVAYIARRTHPTLVLVEAGGTEYIADPEDEEDERAWLEAWSPDLADAASVG